MHTNTCTGRVSGLRVARGVYTTMTGRLATPISCQGAGPALKDLRASQPPEQMARFVAAETVKWAKVVKDSGAKLD